MLVVDPESVGFVRQGGRLRVQFPKVYRRVKPSAFLEPEFYSTHAGLLARIMARYRRNHATARSEDEMRPMATFLGSPSFLDALDAAASLSGDYLENGLYYVRSTVHRSTTTASAVDWSRTVRRRVPVLSDEVPIFLELVARERLRDSTSFLHRLHATAVSRALTLLGRESDVSESIMLSDDEWAAVAKRPREVLEPLMATIFRDRGITLLRLMSQFLLGMRWDADEDEREVPEFCLTQEFELIWEDVVRTLFENPAGAARAALPRGTWRISGEVPRAGIRPRIDALRWIERFGLPPAALLLDAKDKITTESNGRSGSEGDHYKQVMYAQLLDLPDDTILRNVLLFPQLSSNGEVVTLIGTHKWPGLAKSEVWEARVNYEMAVRAYLMEIIWPARSAAEMLLERPDLSGD